MKLEVEVQKLSGYLRSAAHAGLHYFNGIIYTKVCEVSLPSGLCSLFPDTQRVGCEDKKGKPCDDPETFHGKG